MALKKLRMICAGGDKTLAEWDTDTVSAQRLAEIETEFKEKMAQGWFAADISGRLYLRVLLLRRIQHVLGSSAHWVRYTDYLRPRASAT